MEIDWNKSPDLNVEREKKKWNREENWTKNNGSNRNIVQTSKLKILSSTIRLKKPLM